jgi:hypothetical protein
VKSTEQFLELFEEAITRQAEVVGWNKAIAKAKKAGLSVAKDGRIVSCVGNPAVVLLRLIKFFAEDGNVSVLAHCSSLINEISSVPDLFESNSTQR